MAPTILSKSDVYPYVNLPLINIENNAINGTERKKEKHF